MAGNDEDLSAEEMDAVRDTAYFLWEQAGRPEGRASEFWLQAIERYRRDKTYQRWFDEGQQESAAE